MIDQEQQQHSTEEGTIASLVPLKAQWTETYETIQTLSLRIIAHTALQALQSEEESWAKYTALASCLDFVDAYRLCDALALHKQAIEHWMYVSARLWYLRERHELPAEEQQRLGILLESANTQQRKLLVDHLEMQSYVQRYCHSHRILVTFSIIDLALELPVAETTSGNHRFPRRGDIHHDRST